MDYSHLILVAAGLVFSVYGFIKNGKHESGSLPAAMLFLLGMASLTLGILLTCVPGFFSV